MKRRQRRLTSSRFGKTARSFLAAWLLCGAMMIVGAQQVPLSSKEAAVKRKIDRLAAGEEISVIRHNGPEIFATFVSEELDGFTCHNVDTDTLVHLAFAEVKRVKQGYGGYNSLRRTHTDRTKAIVAGAIVLGGILAVVFIAPSH